MTGHTAADGQMTTAHAVGAAAAGLEQATSLTATLTASLSAFRLIRQLARSCEDRAPDLFAAFTSAAGAAAEGCEWIMLAGSCPSPSITADIEIPPSTGAEDIADSLATMATALAGHLTAAAFTATTPGDRAACQNAAAAAQSVHHLLTSPGHEPGPR